MYLGSSDSMAEGALRIDGAQYRRTITMPTFNVLLTLCRTVMTATMVGVAKGSRTCGEAMFLIP